MIGMEMNLGAFNPSDFIETIHLKMMKKSKSLLFVSFSVYQGGKASTEMLGFDVGLSEWNTVRVAPTVSSK